MRYQVEYSKSALKALKKLDRATARLILSWVEKNLSGSSDPRRHGKPLTGNLSGIWRYRIGDYRLLAKIEDDRLVVFMLEIGHRSQIYQ